jgi:hypothetical protein
MHNLRASIKTSDMNTDQNPPGDEKPVFLASNYDSIFEAALQSDAIRPHRGTRRRKAIQHLHGNIRVAGPTITITACVRSPQLGRAARSLQMLCPSRSGRTARVIGLLCLT